MRVSALAELNTAGTASHWVQRQGRLARPGRQQGPEAVSIP